MESEERVGFIPAIPREEELLDSAFGRASKRAEGVESGDRKEAAREKESIRIGIAGDVLSSKLEDLVTATFSYDELDPFYAELIDAMIDVDEFRQALGSVNWASGEISDLKRTYLGRLRNAKTLDGMDELRSEFYGKASATVDKVGSELDYLRSCREELEGLPQLRDLPTVVIAGMPNVGKTSLLAALTGSEPDIRPYPFTTKGLMVGYREGPYGDIQLIDTPGLLDRPPSERNEVERQAVAALKHLSSILIYVFDPAEESNTLEEQESLLDEIRELYKRDVMEVYNKSDLERVEGKRCVSAETGEGLEELWEEITDQVYGGSLPDRKA